MLSFSQVQDKLNNTNMADATQNFLTGKLHTNSEFLCQLIL